MWPVMTLTLLLQLTYEEQLFAQELQPVVLPQAEEQVAPAIVPQETCAQWREAHPIDC